jgi:hypothetical protein
MSENNPSQSVDPNKKYRKKKNKNKNFPNKNNANGPMMMVSA